MRYKWSWTLWKFMICVFISSYDTYHIKTKRCYCSYHQLCLKSSVFDEQIISQWTEFIRNYHPPSIDVWKFALEGSVAGFSRSLSKGITYPLDTIKTFEQRSQETKKKDQIKINYFRGVVPTVVASIPSNALFFIVFNSLNIISLSISDYFSIEGDNNHFRELLVVRLIISAIATLPQNAIKIPFDLLKQLAQTQPNISYTDIIQQIISDSGLWGFYRGWEAQLLREIPYNVIQMTVFVYLIDYLEIPGSIAAAIIGLLAAGIAAILTQPFDVIRTQMTTESANKGRGIIDVIKKVYSSEGIPGFFNGSTERLLIVSFGGMIYFWSSSLVEQYFY